MLLNFIKSLYVEMEYSFSDLPGIITKISESSLCSSLSFLNECVIYINNGTDFPDAWKNSVTYHTRILTLEEKNKIISFGISLGTTDIQGQKKLINLFTGYITSFYENAKIKQDRYYRIYILSGALTGFGIFILLI